VFTTYLDRTTDRAGRSARAPRCSGRPAPSAARATRASPPGSSRTRAARLRQPGVRPRAGLPEAQVLNATATPSPRRSRRPRPALATVAEIPDDFQFDILNIGGEGFPIAGTAGCSSGSAATTRDRGPAEGLLDLGHHRGRRLAEELGYAPLGDGPARRCSRPSTGSTARADRPRGRGGGADPPARGRSPSRDRPRRPSQTRRPVATDRRTTPHAFEPALRPGSGVRPTRCSGSSPRRRRQRPGRPRADDRDDDRDAWPGVPVPGLSSSFFTSDEWRAGFSRNEFTGEYGAFSFIYGTLSPRRSRSPSRCRSRSPSRSTSTASPRKRLKRPLAYTVELLAAIPSVVYGLWGLLFFAPTFILRPVMETPRGPARPVPGRRRPVRGAVFTTSYFTAGNVLAIMILPIITAITREVMAQVPRTRSTPPTAWGPPTGR
jgi:hypothetical protein